MKPMFMSRILAENYSIMDFIESNADLISSGRVLYVGFIETMYHMQEISEDEYISIQDMYNMLNIRQSLPVSKRALYSKYGSGIVVGAGAGDDCIDLIDSQDWILYDLTDERMVNQAVGYCMAKTNFNMVNSREGDTLTNVKDYNIDGVKEIEVITIDSTILSSCDIISIDSEGTALDVLAGAMQTIRKFNPDLLVSIYHNWTEYLLVIPLLYDAGYDISVIKTTNPMPQQPHLELTLHCRHKSNVDR